MVKASVEKWKPAVIAELQRQSVPLPYELILAIMWVESRGKAGLVNKKSGASGLMQVMPGTLLDFNKRHGKNYSIEDLRGDTLSDAVKQIEVGIAIISRYWKSAYRYLTKKLPEIPIDLIARIADLFYVAGPGATQKRLNKLTSINWTNIITSFPEWNALPHPKNVFEYVLENSQPYNMDAIGKWLQTDFVNHPEKDPRGGFAIGVVVLMAAYWLMKGKKK